MRGLAPGIVAGGLLAGAGVFSLLKGTALAVLFALFVFFSASQLLLDRKPKPTRQMPGTLGQLAAGGSIGFVSGLVGAGGAFISVPFMTWCNVTPAQRGGHQRGAGPAHRAGQHGGLHHCGLESGPGDARRAGLPVLLPVLAVIALGSVTAAPLGARAAHTMDVKKLRRIFAVLLYSLGSYMLWRGLAA